MAFMSVKHLVVGWTRRVMASVYTGFCVNWFGGC